jgi:hypothetical protein
VDVEDQIEGRIEALEVFVVALLYKLIDAGVITPGELRSEIADVARELTDYPLPSGSGNPFARLLMQLEQRDEDPREAVRRSLRVVRPEDDG